MTDVTKAADEKTETLQILVYSDDVRIRNDVMAAVGRRVAKDLPEVVFTESANWEAAMMKIKETQFDLLILDAETTKLGGVGLGKMVRDEVDAAMPYIVVIARPQDEWLARVSKPNGIISQPIDPRELQAKVAEVLHARKALV